MNVTSDAATIREAIWPADAETVRTLFREYESWTGMDLCFQGFEQELNDLPGKYAKPEGNLYLAEINGEAVGCIALRPLGKGTCEMKRLYLRGPARGAGIGSRLVDVVIINARAIGYELMRLDTYPPKMGKAVSLYEARGFHRIEPYYNNPHEGVLFMELEL
jgi:putative acetyltransferase